MFVAGFFPITTSKMYGFSKEILTTRMHSDNKTFYAVFPATWYGELIPEYHYRLPATPSQSGRASDLKISCWRSRNWLL
jgi:hypothetical protein